MLSEKHNLESQFDVDNKKDIKLTGKLYLSFHFDIAVDMIRLV